MSRMKSKREMKPERGMTLNIHVVFNNKMKSFILNRFQFNKKKKKKSCRDASASVQAQRSTLHKSSERNGEGKNKAACHTSS